jgi:hypothetical protein
MENKLRDIVQGSAPSEMKEETTYSAVRAGNVGTLTTLGTGCTSQRKMMVINLD